MSSVRRNCGQRREVETAGLDNQFFACVLLQRLPRSVCLLRQLDVLRRVVREPDDARMVLRSAARVADLELLQSEHVSACVP